MQCWRVHDISHTVRWLGSIIARVVTSTSPLCIDATCRLMLHRRRRRSGQTRAKATAKTRSTTRSCRAAWTPPGSGSGVTQRCRLVDRACHVPSMLHLRDTSIQLPLTSFVVHQILHHMLRSGSCPPR